MDLARVLVLAFFMLAPVGKCCVTICSGSGIHVAPVLVLLTKLLSALPSLVDCHSHIEDLKFKIGPRCFNG